jgi:nucleotide-binding universal stress UspA family protein
MRLFAADHDRMSGQIMLATDFAATSAAAASEALRLARALDSNLLIVSVIDQGALALAGFRRRVDQERAGLELEAAELTMRARRAGVAARFLIWDGVPGEAIVDAARSERVDLIVVGSHARGPLGRALIGSVSDHVVRHAPCPVLVARARPEPLEAAAEG